MDVSGQKRKADATRKRLLDAALRVIARKGYSSATVDEIVAEAGVSKGLAYYHFKNKAAIASSILETGVNDMIGSFETIAAESKSAGQALTRMLDSFCGAIVNNQEFAQFFLNELWRGSRDWSSKLRPIEDKLIGILSNQIERGQQEGVIRAEVDPQFGAVAIVGISLTAAGYYVGRIDGIDADQGERFKAYVYDFVAHAVEAETAFGLGMPSTSQVVVS